MGVREFFSTCLRILLHFEGKSSFSPLFLLCWKIGPRRALSWQLFGRGVEEEEEGALGQREGLIQPKVPALLVCCVGCWRVGSGLSQLLPVGYKAKTASR